jgi:hypothetical protein
MSTTSVETATRDTRVPPEESFWQHYSPHHEAPLSGVGSFALHCIIAGVLLLGGYLGWLGFASKPPRPKVGVVSIPRGEGEARLGTRDGTKTHGEEIAKFSGADDVSHPAAPVATPGLPEVRPEQQRPDAKSHEPRPVVTGDVVGMMQNLQHAQDQVGSLKRAPLGSPDGSKTAKENGGGGPAGSIAADPVPRGQRWDLHFNTLDAKDYLRQLQGLGAVLVIPTGPNGAAYKVVRELSRRPVRLLDEDVAAIPGICWKDYEQRAVAGVARELGLAFQPDHFGAFLPLELEEKLARLERDYAGRNERQIARTHFRVEISRGKYDVRVVDQEVLR